jgi:hypothetical protein
MDRRVDARSFICSAAIGEIGNRRRSGGRMQNRNGVRPRKLVATLVMAAVFFWAPSVIPVRASPPTPCGIPLTWRTADTVYAFPAVVPCPPIHAPTPWPVIIGMLSAVSVIVNAAIISRTQCRELTQQEAWSSIFLPFIGMLWNRHLNKCHR